MIVDYLIDYSYLIKEIHKNPIDSAFFLGLKVLFDAVAFDNARIIVVDEIASLKEEIVNSLDKKHWECEEKKRKIETFFENEKPSSYYRKILNDEKLSKELPVFVISDEKRVLDVEFSKSLTLDKYYHYKDREMKRIRWTKMMHFEGGNKTSSEDELFEMINRFGGSSTSFSIFDRYGINLGDDRSDEGKFNKVCRSILYWVKMLSNNFKKKCVFDLWVNCKPDYCELNAQRDILKNDLSEKLKSHKKKFKGLQNVYEQILRFHLVPGDGRTFQMKSFHDRFICSDSRFFSIGKGLDVFDENGVPECVNIQYCGLCSRHEWINKLRNMSSYYIAIDI